MKTTLIFTLFLLFSTFAFCQKVERVVVDGSITAPIGEPVEGIHIYNISAQKGTITDENGFFKMEMAENDRLEVTALQFLSFKVIVDNGIVTNKQIKIYMNPAVNELAEVIIRPYDLSGNIKVDVSKIKTFDATKGLDLSYEELTFAYDFAPDAQTSIQGNFAEEVFYNGQSQYGGNILGVFSLISDVLFGKPKPKKTEKQIEEEYQILQQSFRNRFTADLLKSRFSIPEDKAEQFLYFLEDSNIPKDFLKNENELVLYNYVTNQSKIFLTQFEK